MSEESSARGIVRFAQSVDRGLAVLEKQLLAWAIILMAVNTIANVCARLGFSSSLFFSEELNQFLIVLVTFVGTSAAARQGRHIRMSALTDLLGIAHRRRMFAVMQVITAVVVVIFGGLTLILRDDTFVKMKPTILYCLFAGILGFGLLRGQSYLKYLMDELIPMRDEGWMKFTTRFVVFYLALAALNELVWRVYGTDAWVNFRTFVLPLANFGFVMAQVPLFQRYAVSDGSNSGA